MNIRQTMPSLEAIEAFIDQTFVSGGHNVPRITHMDIDQAELSLDIEDYHTRPGGFISGPTQMTLADHVAYIAVFTRLGITPMAVTSNLNIDFLRPCIGEVLRARTHQKTGPDARCYPCRNLWRFTG